MKIREAMKIRADCCWPHKTGGLTVKVCSRKRHYRCYLSCQEAAEMTGSEHVSYHSLHGLEKAFDCVSW